MLASRTFLLYLLLLVFTGAKGEQCVVGWFGDKCQYQCHCLEDANCDQRTGDCPGDCDRGWFGPQCQYYNAAGAFILNHRNYPERRCLYDYKTDFTLSMSYSVMFTWMRIGTHRPGIFDRMNMTFLSSDKTEVAPISPLTKIYVGDTILEVYGELQDRFKYIRVQVDRPETRLSFSSLQVSAGRNVAIKQKASQSSTWSTGAAQNAVDGRSTDYYWAKGSCSSTNVEENPSWTLHLSSPVIVNMYKVFVMYDDWGRCKVRYFRLESYNQSTKVQQYDRTTSVDTSLSYKVYTLNNIPITSVTISVSKSRWPNGEYTCDDGKHTLGFCELQVFGDVVCPPGKWGRDCEKNCYCQDPCFVSTGRCPSGCKAGFRGPRCREECPDGRWGVDCLNSCDMCLNGNCNKSSGECLSGCVSGYKLPDCVKECDAGFHGYGCYHRCPANCQDNMCNNVDGKCTKCVAGYQGPVCYQECDATFYGEDCAAKCSDMCVDQLCHHITGVCDSCPIEKHISKDCSQEADKLNVVIIVVPIVLILIAVAGLIAGICLWRRRKVKKAGDDPALNDEPANGPPQGFHKELEEKQPTNVQVTVGDNYERISFTLNEGNPHSAENENTNPNSNGRNPAVNEYDRISPYVNEKNPPFNEYEKVGANKEKYSNVYSNASAVIHERSG